MHGLPAGTVHDNWLTEPDTAKKVRIRSWKVFNTDGSPWIEIDNEGYAIEHYYDANGIEIETVNPDATDIHNFANPIEVYQNGADEWVPLNPPEDFDNFYTEYLIEDTNDSFLKERENNPGARMEIDYQNEFLKTFADIDVSAGDVKETGMQKDGLGNVEQEIEYGPDGEEYVKIMHYDSLGRMVGLTDPDASPATTSITVHETTFRKHDKTWVVWYDDLGRKLRVLYPETEPGRSDTKYITYNDAENSMTTIDPTGRTIYERHDWNGNIVEVVAYGNGTTNPADYQNYAYEYDELNRKVSFTDPKGIKTGYTYDERDLLTEQDYGATGKDSMVYNNLGQLEKKTDRKGQVIAFTYDEMGRNTQVLHYADEQAYDNDEIVRSVKTVYDNRGNAVRINNEHLIEHYIYDYGNRVITLERRLVDLNIRTELSAVWGGDQANQEFNFSYEYNDAGMVTRMIYPDGAVHDFHYDGHPRTAYWNRCRAG